MRTSLDRSARASYPQQWRRCASQCLSSVLHVYALELPFALLPRRGLRAIPPAKLRQIIAQVDVNNNGELDYDECKCTSKHC